jgi:hypothetical protein
VPSAGAGRVWAPGERALYRFVRTTGSVGTVHPMRVVADDGRRLLGWVPEGTPVVVTRLADGREQRQAPLRERFRLPRVRLPGRWRDSSTLRLVDGDAWSSVWWFFAPDGEFRNWYVNLELPVGRTQSTVDRVDGVLDVHVEPDGTWRWKDEDEAVAAVAAGLFDAAQMAGLRAEGERMIALAEAGRFPFDGTWCDFRPDPGWPPPDLPEDAMPGDDRDATPTG